MSYNSPATTELFNEKLIELVRNLPEDQDILELGSGYTSSLIYQNLNGNRYQALEQSEKWYKDIVDQCPPMVDHVIYAPLVSDGLSTNSFFDLSKVTVDNVGLLIIDGPTGGKRWPGTFLCWKFLAEKYILLADDMFREQYKNGLDAWSWSNNRVYGDRNNNPEYFGQGNDQFAIYRGTK